MAKKASKKLLPAILLSLAVGCLGTLALVYSPDWIQRETVHITRVFSIADSTPPPDTILIAVRNGAGVSDLAMRAQNYLETRTGDVIFFAPGPPQNAPEMDYAVTVILSHDTSFSAALKVAEVLEIGDSSVVMLLPPPGRLPVVDVTIILGRDRNDPSFFIPYRD